jgi:hypothetical protein
VEWVGDARSLASAIEGIPGYRTRTTAVTANTLAVRIGDHARNASK